MKKKSSVFTDYGTLEFTYRDQDIQENNKSVVEKQDQLIPSFHDHTRNGSLSEGIFHVVSTSLDGTVLTIPYLMYKCGIIVGFLTILTVSVLSGLTLEFLTICSRKTGSRSYTEIVQKLLGNKIRILFTYLLFLILVFILIGFYLLIKNISISILRQFDPHSSVAEYPEFILLLLTIPIIPFLLSENVHSLRFTCIAACFSLFFLILMMISTIIIEIHSLEYLYDTFLIMKQYPSSLSDYFECLPIVLMLYLNHFNFLSVISQLKEPTIPRIRTLIVFTVSILAILFTTIGILGNLIFYLLSADNPIPEDNILNSLSVDHRVLLVSRLTTMIVLLTTIPVMFVPARSLFMEIFAIILCEQEETNSLHIDIESNEYEAMPESAYQTYQEQEYNIPIKDSHHTEINVIAPLSNDMFTLDIISQEGLIPDDDYEFKFGHKTKPSMLQEKLLTKELQNTLNDLEEMKWKQWTEETTSFTTKQTMSDPSSISYTLSQDELHNENIFHSTEEEEECNLLLEREKEREKEVTLKSRDNNIEIKEEIVRIMIEEIPISKGFKYIVSILLLGSVITIAVCVSDKIAFVWEVSGSIICPWITIILPSIGYIELRYRSKARFDWRVPIAKTLIILGLLTFIICTMKLIV